MTISFEQIKLQHLGLIESLFNRQVKAVNFGIPTLLKKMSSLRKVDTDIEKLRYLNEIRIFWKEYYQELCRGKGVNEEDIYRRFRQTGEKLQGRACYDLAADLLHIATEGLGASKTNIHQKILEGWKDLAGDMRELRVSFRAILSYDGEIQSEETRILLIETRKTLLKARRSLKRIYGDGNNDEITEAIHLFQRIARNIPREIDTQAYPSDINLNKIKDIIKKGNAILVLGDFINGSQTNISGNVQGPVLSGEFKGDVKVGLDGDQFEKVMERVIQLIRIKIPAGKDQETALVVVQKVQYFGKLHEKLKEWKEIHDRLTTIINFVDKFSTGVEQYTELYRVTIEWGFVTNAINHYRTYYVENIKIIDRYEEIEGSPRYGDWIVLVEKGYEDIAFELGLCSKTSLARSRNAILGKTNALLHILMAYLEQVDKHLLKVANDLQNISEQIANL